MVSELNSDFKIKRGKHFQLLPPFDPKGYDFTFESDFICEIGAKEKQEKEKKTGYKKVF